VCLVVVGALVLSTFSAAAEGNLAGDFPNRTFEVIRSHPGGPRSDTYQADIAPAASGMWYVTLESLAGSSVIVQVWEETGGVSALLTTSKLRAIGQESSRTPLFGGMTYSVTFTPYGKAGSSILQEHYALPSPPTACFTFSPAAPTTADVVTFVGTCSSDPDNDIRTYAWDFNGDNVVDATGATAQYQYLVAGTYTVNLIVTDAALLTDSASATVSVSAAANIAPHAAFSVTRDLMVASVDASGSADPDGTITGYAWDFGDGSSGSGVTTTHEYLNPGLYPITLTVTDNGGLSGFATGDVSVNTWTVDFTYHDFFNVPYGEWWDMRSPVYGDKPIGANCFNADAIVDGFCKVTNTAIPEVESYPYTDWYPSPIDATGKFAFVYAPYRFDAVVKNSPAYTIDQPVLLPTCAQLSAAATSLGLALSCPASMPADGQVTLDLYLQYMDIAREVEIQSGPAPNDCPDLTSSNDGFIIEERMTMVLDPAAMAKVFGITSPGGITSTLFKSGCGSATKFDTTKSGVIEKAYAAWLASQGNGPYDIFAAYEYTYTMFFMDIGATYDSGSGLYTVTFHSGSWGEEALLGRKFHWGATPYTSGAADPSVQATGWWGMELPWFEDLNMHATIGTSFTATLSGAMQYHFQHGALPGADNTFRTADDVPTWLWQPTLADYIYASGSHAYSELTRYLGVEYVHTTPGSKNYGLLGAYDYVPQLWPLSAGQTQTWIFPTGPVVLYDPYLSVGTTDGSGLVPISAALVLSGTLPAAYGVYLAASNTLIAMGPTSVGSVPTTAAGAPLESRPIPVLVHA